MDAKITQGTVLALALGLTAAGMVTLVPGLLPGNDVPGVPGVPGSGGVQAPWTEPASAPVGDDGRTYEPNLWLLDAPRPDNTFVSTGGEPKILADADGDWLWVASTGGGYRSPDGGDTWERVPTPWLKGRCDGWSLAQDGTGDLYAATTMCPYVNVVRSTDDGASWEQQSKIPEDAAPVADRPWIAAHGDGEVALIHWDYGRTHSESCLRSTDGGTTWTDRSSLLAQPQAGNLEFDQGGNLYFVEDDGTLYRFKQNSQGLTCIDFPDRFDMFPAGKGSQHMLQVAVEPDGSAVHSAAPTVDNGAIVLSGTRDLRSVKTLQVSPEVLNSTTYAAISLRGGQIAVAYYGSETPGDPNDARFDGSWNVFVAVVEGFWTSDPQVTGHRLTDDPNHVGEICMDGAGCEWLYGKDRDLLDYFGVDHAADGSIHVAYGDDYRKTASIYHAGIPAS